VHILCFGGILSYFHKEYFVPLLVTHLVDRYELTEPADGAWGALVDGGGGAFSGLVGQLQRRVPLCCCINALKHLLKHVLHCSIYVCQFVFKRSIALL